MVRYCAAKGCNKNDRNSKGTVTFHRFPAQAERRGRWLENMGASELWAPTKNGFLCSNHFLSHCFYFFNDAAGVPGRTNLKTDAVPTLFGSALLHTNCSSIASKRPVTVTEATSETKEAKTLAAMFWSTGKETRRLSYHIPACHQ